MNEHGMGFIPAERLIRGRSRAIAMVEFVQTKAIGTQRTWGVTIPCVRPKTCIEPSLREVPPSIQHLRKRAAR
ncbi:hypothetical protein [Paraburkholderia sp. BR14374]|uniref:hypothetical protein n=1 Tax=Paraburkholderia sp. BR14374 TaxID=3237007 RepID=UPI0034CE846C